jgi:signal transduction histidine kinase
VPRTGLWLRVFVALLLAVLPPILLLVGTLLLTRSLLRDYDPALIAVAVVVATVVWAAVLGIVYTRSLADDMRSILDLAQRGESLDQRDIGSAYQQVAATLAERNRQIEALVREANAVPIADDPKAVVMAMVSAVRSIMGDTTWRAAVITSDDAALLPPGVYGGTDEEARPETIADLEQWASVSLGDRSASRVEGPWGAFAVVRVVAGSEHRAMLYAPWEGRAEPSPAEIALLSLVGQHAGTAIEHSLLYARLRAQTDELERMTRIQADFLRGVTHDLQTPLTSISALATELGADDSLSPSAISDLRTIEYQSDRLRRMVGQLLIASRLEAGVFTPQIDVFAVAPLVERTWKALRADRPFQLEITGKPHLAVGDQDRAEQVLWALLDNAVKYSPPGSPIVVHIVPRDGGLAITVRDRGAGMDPETRMRAFDQFYRSADARRLAPDGSGVGLYAARGLVEAMGGSITIESGLGAGTAVTVVLPAEQADAEADISAPASDR